MSNLAKRGIPGYEVSTTTGRIPAEETLTGLISHTNNTKIVTGDADVDLTKVRIGDYIYANSVLRKITEIDVDKKKMLVESTFGGDLTNADFKVCRGGVYRRVKIENTHASAASTVLGASVKAGKIVEYYEPGGLDPLFFDATSSELSITTQK